MQFAAPALTGKTIGTGSYLLPILVYSSGTLNSATIDTWGWQLEAGSVATAFQTATGTLQGETSACQRYYYRWVAGSTYNYAGNGMANSTTVAPMIFKYPTTMRIAPTAIDFANMSTNDTATVTAISALALTYAGVDSSQLTATVASGLTANRPYFLAANNNAAAYVGVSAEL
jgi:hypothetical protein